MSSTTTTTVASTERDGRRFGGGSKRYQPPEQPAGKMNVTDPDSRDVKTTRGYMQGYNAQAACNEQQIVIAAEVSIASSDFGQLEPMVSATQTELQAAGVTDALDAGVATPATGIRSSNARLTSDLSEYLHPHGRRTPDPQVVARAGLTPSVEAG